LNGVVGGVALSQGSNTGKFTSQSVMNFSYAYGVIGTDANQNGSGLVNIGGGFGFNSDGTVSGAMAYNDLDIHNGNTITGNYTVDPTGRVAISNVVPSNITGATFAFQAYLGGTGDAVVIGIDQNETSGGLSYVQNANGDDHEGNFALSAQGILGGSGSEFAAVGPINISSGNITGTVEYSAQGFNLAPGFQMTGMENSSTGLLTINSGLDPNGNTVGYGYYPIDSNHVLAVSVSNLQIGVMMLEGITVTK
jgi:hypothetical protein